MTSAWCLRLAAGSGFLVVALGAFGAHALRSALQVHQTLEIWEKAVLYHAVHTFALLALARQPVIARGTVISFVCGILLFSGSLYLLAVTNMRWLGAITPLGGVSLLIGWVWLFFSRSSRQLDQDSSQDQGGSFDTQSPEKTTTFLVDHVLPTIPDASYAEISNASEAFRSHLNRIRRDMNDARMRAILDEVEERFFENALAITGMVQQTLSDRRLHTKAIAGGNVTTWVVVSVVPRNRHDAAAFFSEEYPPGYSGYVNFWLNSQPAKVALTMGHTVFAHVLVYADISSRETISVGLGLNPLDLSNLGACPQLVFPTEAMTREDRRQMGI
jgi:uncharacterized membrane protein YgdD (TMEM256/DUF423 family)